MRSPILPLLALVSACSFPVEEFAVTDGGRIDAATGSDVQDTTPAPSTSTDAASSTDADSGIPCQCVEYKGIDCKRWAPDKCGEK